MQSVGGLKTLFSLHVVILFNSLLFFPLVHQVPNKHACPFPESVLSCLNTAIKNIYVKATDD